MSKSKIKNVYDVSKVLECGVCIELLDDPKMLDCQHSFCRDCLDDLLKFNNDGSAVLPCPMRCDGNTRIDVDETTEQLKVPYQLKEISNIYKELHNSTNSNQNGNLCNGKKGCTNGATLYCLNCHHMMCKICECLHGKHDKIQVKYSNVNNQLMGVCDEHNSIVNCVCCEDKLICMYCQGRTHHDHDYKTVKSQADPMKELLIGEEEHIKTRSEDIKRNVDITKENVAKVRESFSQILKVRKFNRLFEYLSMLENEEERLMLELDEVMKSHIENYPDISSGEFLKTITTRSDLEIYLKKGLINNTYSSLTTNIPTLCVGLSEGCMLDTHALGELIVDYGEHVSVSRPFIGSSVLNNLPVFDTDKDVSVLVNKLEYLMKECKEYAACIDGEELTTAFAPSDKEGYEYAAFVEEQLTTAFATFDKQGYECIENLCKAKDEGLLIKMLPMRKVIYELKSINGNTILHHAVEHGCNYLLEYILNENGVHIDTRNNQRWTALHYAVKQNNIVATKLLVAHNCSLDATDLFGKTPLYRAREGCHKTIEQLLEDAYEQR